MPSIFLRSIPPRTVSPPFIFTKTSSACHVSESWGVRELTYSRDHAGRSASIHLIDTVDWPKLMSGNARLESVLSFGADSPEK